MSKPRALKALDPVWFRFTDPDDQGKYGDGWFVYDESTILRLPARVQIEVESALNMPLVAVMNGFRTDTTLGELAASWLGVRQVDPARAGDFEEFNPLVHLIEWTIVEPEGKAEASAEVPENTTSVQTATVTLPALPITESSF